MRGLNTSPNPNKLEKFSVFSTQCSELNLDFTPNKTPLLAKLCFIHIFKIDSSFRFLLEISGRWEGRCTHLPRQNRMFNID
jgi:hypothetical protein